VSFNVARGSTVRLPQLGRRPKRRGESGTVPRREALDNQRLFITAFSLAVETAVTPVIFDGHCLIDSGSHLIEIPVEVIEAPICGDCR
jgi:hypothetical protein